MGIIAATKTQPKDLQPLPDRSPAFDLKQPLIFDGHNDLLLKVQRAGGLSALSDYMEGGPGHLDLPKAKAGGFGGGFFAIYVPSASNADVDDLEMREPPYDLPLPDAINWEDAMTVAMSQFAVLLRLEEQGGLKIARTAREIPAIMAQGQVAAIAHMEGAEAIDPDFETLEVLYAAGLRSLGPVWSRPTIYGHGVPFRFPSDGDIGPGLTDHGIRLVRRCDEMGVMIDLSHLNEAGFWDVARHSTKPLVATHSNAHALSASARNLTDKQLDAIAETDGMVGLNFATAFLREDGRMDADTPLDTMLRHLDHLMSRLGEDRVGFGSDFDGAMVPAEIGDVSGLPALRKAMMDHGYDAALLEKLCHRNWVRVLEASWGH